MKNKSLIVLIIIFAALIVSAGVLYKNLSADMETSQIQVQITPAPVNSDSPAAESTEAPSAEKEEAQSSDAEKEQLLAPDFTVYDIDGNPVNLSDFRGKPTFINFWASWCFYCIAEMPEFQAKFEELGDEVNFLMINVTDGSQETVESASKFIEDSGYTFPVYYDTDQTASYIYGAYSLPMTYGINADGYAVVKATGAIGAEDIDGMLEMLK